MKRAVFWRRKLTYFLLGLVLVFFAIAALSYNSEARADLITQLREAFNISFTEATNEQLGQFLKDKNNRTFAEGMLKQLRHGQQLQLFLDGQSNQLPNLSKEALKYLARKLVIDLLKLIGDKAGIFWLSAGSQLIGVLSTISSGVSIFLRLSDALVAFDSRVMLNEYINGREQGQSPVFVFQDLYNVFQPVIDKIICFRIMFKCLRQGGVTEEDRQNFATYLEFSYQSWKLVNDQGRKNDVKRYILDNLPRPNRPPIANAGPDQTVLVNSIVQLDGSSSSDPDGDPIKSYRWKILPQQNSARCVFKSSSSLVNPKVQPRREGSCTIELVVSDGKLNSTPDYVTITAQLETCAPTNQRPPRPPGEPPGVKITLSKRANVILTVLRGEEAIFNNLVGLDSPTKKDLYYSKDVTEGQQFNLGTFKRGTEFVFRITTPEGKTYFTGPANRNPDGLVHANVQQISENRWLVGWEDRFGGGDKDYDDVFFLICGLTTEGSVASLTQTRTIQQLKVDTYSTRQDGGAVRFFIKDSDFHSLTVHVFDLSGHPVFRTGWVENGFEWNLLNDRGQRLVNGVYLYVVTARTWDGRIIRSEVKKLVVLR